MCVSFGKISHNPFRTSFGQFVPPYPTYGLMPLAIVKNSGHVLLMSHMIYQIQIETLDYEIISTNCLSCINHAMPSLPRPRRLSDRAREREIKKFAFQHLR